MSTDDIAHIPHIVIIETASEIKIVEFDKGRMLDAHDFAQRIAMHKSFNGRVIVAAKVRTLQPAAYALQHGT